MKSYHISDDIKVTFASTYASAATDLVTSDEIDMAGYDGLLWVTRVGTAAANQILTHQDHATSGSEADTVAHVHSDSTTEVLWLDIKHPLQYCKATLARGTSTTADPIIAIQYRGRTCPVDNTVTGTITGLQFDAPAK